MEGLPAYRCYSEKFGGQRISDKEHRHLRQYHGGIRPCTSLLNCQQLPGIAQAESATPPQSVDVAEEIPHRTCVKAYQERQIPEIIFKANLSAQADVHLFVTIIIIVHNTRPGSNVPVKPADDFPVPVINTVQGKPGVV